MTNILRKHLIFDEPKAGDVSQYTFVPYETNFSYNNSTSLPKNNDKFQNKDLNITTIGSELNEKIIDRNIKAEGTSFIRIDKCFVEFVGTPSPLKEVSVKMWMMSDKFVQDNDGNFSSYSNIKALANVKDLEDRVFFYEAGRLGNNEDLGNLSFVEGVNILSNISGSIADIQQDNFSSKTEEYNPETMLLRHITTDTITTIFDETTFNPIYMIFKLSAHGDQPSDDRDSRWQVFRIDNLELFEVRSGVRAGILKTFTFNEMFYTEQFGEESGGGIDDSALRITELQVTVNTQTQPPNSWGDTDDEKLYRDYFHETQPSIIFNPSFYDSDADRTTFLAISPENQLDNFEPPGTVYPAGGNENVEYELFPDYFPKQHIGILDTTTDELVNDVYLDEYRDDMDEQIIALGSAPARISFDFEMVSGLNASMTRLLPATSGHGQSIAEDYYYFVINWDDKDNEIKSIEEWLKVRPTTYRELLELQQNNLYSVVRQTQTTDDYDNYSINTRGKRLSNTYIIPGIKTIKTIMFSYDASTNQIGRWKLLTSRFYLDIPLNQYPDFGEVGGSDYTTLPWPFTTAVIGGVSEDSKYKKSVQETLSSGNIGDTDIIDETFLINDIDNDELGVNIEKMDLEQVRYFSKPYGMNDLLNLVYSEGLVGENIYLTSDEHLRTLPGYKGGGVIDGDPHMTINELSWTPVGESNPAFGEDGYLLSIYTYDELKELWEFQQSRINLGLESTILKAMNDFVYYNLDTSNWIYNEEDLNTFIYEGFISAETGLFVNDMAVAIYRLEVGLYPEIPDYEVQPVDINQWNVIGRPDIASFLTSVLQEEAQPNPPIIDEEGNQTFVGGDGGFGGAIEEGGINGSEPHFQGGYPGGGSGDNNTTPDFPPALPLLNLLNPNQSLTVATGDVLTIEWEQMEDTTLHAVSPGDYGAPGTANAYYYSQGKFPAAWNYVNIELVSQNQGGFPDIYVGNIGPNQGEDLNTQYPGAHRSFSFTIPSAEDVGLNEEVIESFDVRLSVSDGAYSIESISSLAIQVSFRIVGGNPPPIGTRPKKYFENTTFITLETTLPNRYNQINPNGTSWWDGVQNKFPEESSVGQIFITDNKNINLKQSCKLELNTGEITDNSIYDSSGRGSKGLLIGDYKLKKNSKGTPMKRDSFIKVPKKTGNNNGAL